MIFYFVVGFCAVLITVSLMEYLNAKKRLVDHKLDQIIAKKLMTHRDRQAIEILNLREACGVMRNLLLDIAENEASLDAVSARTPDDIKTKLISSRNARRRELCAEVDAVIRSSAPSSSVDASM